VHVTLFSSLLSLGECKLFLFPSSSYFCFLMFAFWCCIFYMHCVFCCSCLLRSFLCSLCCCSKLFFYFHILFIGLTFQFQFNMHNDQLTHGCIGDNSWSKCCSMLKKNPNHSQLFFSNF
jgi:hypothetical protein